VLVVDKVAVIRKHRDRYVRLVERARLDITILTPSRWIENTHPAPYERAEGEPFDVVIGRSSWPGHEIKSLYYSGMIRAFRRSRPEVILMMEEAFSLFALQVVFLRRLLAPRAPIIFYSALITSWEDSVYRPRWFFRSLGKFILKRTEGAIGLNETATRMLLEAGFTSVRTHFFGVDERVFLPRDRASARREIGIDPEADVFLFAGRLIALKGVQDLIEAFARVRARRGETGMKLLIVGRGDYEGELRELAGTLGLGDDIEFRESVPIERMPLHMSAATALVLPSRAEWLEQFGRVLVEAMLAETPVIGSTSGEIPVVIADAGYIYPAGDVDALAGAIEEVLDHPDEALERIRRGRRRALREFSSDAFIEGLVRLFEDYSGRSLRRASEED
jgi:glycosyltransferase involved in cell wall biosynthesis